MATSISLLTCHRKYASALERTCIGQTLSVASIQMCIQKAMMGTTKRKMSSVDASMDATKDATTAECNFIATKIIVIKAPTVETDSSLMKT